MPALESSALRHVSYDPERQELHVRFRGGGRYVYHDVPAEGFGALLEAPSRGAYLNREIKGRYRCERRGGPERRRIWLDEARYPFRKNSA